MSKGKKKIYYGWIITLLAGLTYFGSNGLLSTSSGNIISQLLLEKGWDATSVSLTYTIRSVLGLSLPLVGLLLLKIGPRICICVTTLITAVFLALTGWVNTPLMFVLVYGIAVSFSMLFNDQLACFAVVNNWWDKRRGEQGGYVQALGGLGGVVFPPLIAVLFTHFSWKVSLIIMAVLLVAITALPQWFLMKDYPSQMGLEVDGGVVEEKSDKKENVKVEKRYYQSPVNWDVKDAVATPQIWIMGITWGGVTFGYCAVMYFGITHMMMNGFGQIQAASLVSALSLFILIGSLVLSRITDRINPRISLFLISLLCGIGYLVFNFGVVNNSVPVIILGMALAGLPDGPILAAIMNGICSFYGSKNYAAIQPYCNIVLTIIASVSSVACGAVLTKTGSLSGAYYISAIFAVIVAFMALALKPPKVTEKLKEKYAARDAAEAKIAGDELLGP